MTKEEKLEALNQMNHNTLMETLDIRFRMSAMIFLKRPCGRSEGASAIRNFARRCEHCFGRNRRQRIVSHVDGYEQI